MTADTAALVAQGYAALHQLPRITLAMVELDVPAVIDRDSWTVYIQRGLEPEDVVVMVREGIRALCRGRTVVERDDGEGTEWAQAVGGEYDPSLEAEQARPVLRLV